MNLDQEVLEKYRAHYAHLHPMIFARSVERARTQVELFDILEGVPAERPVRWSSEESRWVATNHFSV